MNHKKYVDRTYQLAKEAAEKGNFPFGALLADKSGIIRTSMNTVESDMDITAHPELKLARWAAQNISSSDLSDTILYSSTEPCPMCAGAIYWSGLSTVVYGVEAESTGGSNLIPSLSCNTVLDSGNRDLTIIGPISPSQGEDIHKEYWQQNPENSFSKKLFSDN